MGLAGCGITAQQANAAFAQAGPDLAQFRTLQARFQDRGARVSDQRFAAALFASTRRWRPTARASSPRSKPCSGRARASLRPVAEG
jgi:hypothetical protein